MFVGELMRVLSDKVQVYFVAMNGYTIRNYFSVLDSCKILKIEVEDNTLKCYIDL